MDSLREELSTILAEKDRTEGLMEKLKVDLDTVEQGYLNLKAGTLRQNDIRRLLVAKRRALLQ